MAVTPVTAATSVPAMVQPAFLLLCGQVTISRGDTDPTTHPLGKSSLLSGFLTPPRWGSLAELAASGNSVGTRDAGVWGRVGAGDRKGLCPGPRGPGEVTHRAPVFHGGLAGSGCRKESGGSGCRKRGESPWTPRAGVCMNGGPDRPDGDGERLGRGADGESVRASCPLLLGHPLMAPALRPGPGLGKSLLSHWGCRQRRDICQQPPFLPQPEILRCLQILLPC